MNMRRQVVVEKKLQLRFARFVILLTGGAALLTGLAAFYVTYFILGERLSLVYPQSDLIPIFRIVHVGLIAVLLGISPFIFYISLVFSHRIAGPLPKIYRTLRAIGEGQYDQKLVLRKKDELLELADVINEMAAKLKERHKV